MELPSHPESDRPDASRPVEKNWAGIVVVGVVGALVVVVIVLHLTGVVGPAAH